MSLEKQEWVPKIGLEEQYERIVSNILMAGNREENINNASRIIKNETPDETSELFQLFNNPPKKLAISSEYDGITYEDFRMSCVVYMDRRFLEHCSGGAGYLAQCGWIKGDMIESVSQRWSQSNGTLLYPYRNLVEVSQKIIASHVKSVLDSENVNITLINKVKAAIKRCAEDISDDLDSGYNAEICSILNSDAEDKSVDYECHPGIHRMLYAPLTLGFPPHPNASIPMGKLRAVIVEEVSEYLLTKKTLVELQHMGWDRYTIIEELVFSKELEESNKKLFILGTELAPAPAQLATSKQSLPRGLPGKESLQAVWEREGRIPSDWENNAFSTTRNQRHGSAHMYAPKAIRISSAGSGFLLCSPEKLTHAYTTGPVYTMQSEI